MKTIMNILNKNGYIFYNGKLQWFEFKSALVDFNSGEVQYECKLGGEEMVLLMSECPELYESEKHYEGKNAMDVNSIDWREALGRVFNADTNRQTNESGECKLWQIKNDQPVEKDAPKANFLYKNGKWRMEIEYVGKWQFFRSREHALMYCDLIIVDGEGNERTEKSAAKKMLLNDEQKKAVQAIKDAIDASKKLGVELLWDRECDDLYAFSKNEIERYEIDCKCYNGKDERVDYTDLLEETGISIYSTNMCDCGIFVDWKK